MLEFKLKLKQFIKARDPLYREATYKVCFVLFYSFNYNKDNICLGKYYFLGKLANIYISCSHAEH